MQRHTFGLDPPLKPLIDPDFIPARLACPGETDGSTPFRSVLGAPAADRGVAAYWQPPGARHGRRACVPKALSCDVLCRSSDHSGVALPYGAISATIRGQKDATPRFRTSNRQDQSSGFSGVIRNDIPLRRANAFGSGTDAAKFGFGVGVAAGWWPIGPRCGTAQGLAPGMAPPRPPDTVSICRVSSANPQCSRTTGKPSPEQWHAYGFIFLRFCSKSSMSMQGILVLCCSPFSWRPTREGPQAANMTISRRP